MTLIFMVKFFSKLLLISVLATQLAVAGEVFIWGTNGGSSAAKNLTNQICFANGTCFTSTGVGGITQLTGDVTAGPGSGSQAATIANLAVTNAKIANSTIDLTTKVTGTLPLANGGFGLPNTQTDISTTGTITSITPTTTFINFTSNAATKTLNSMVSNATNQRVVIRNTGTQSLTIKNQESGSTAANRFQLEQNTDLILATGMESEFLYNTTASRWNMKETRNIVISDGTNNLISVVSGQVTSGGNFNTILGPQAISAGTFSGAQNVIIGYQTAQNASGAGSNNVLIGTGAGKALTHSSGSQGNSNVCVGPGACPVLTTGTDNVMGGQNSGKLTTTSSESVFFGSNSGGDNISGNYGIAIGLGAGVNHQTGDFNISIGQSSGSGSATNLTNTIAIGQQSRVTSSNQGNIGSGGTAMNIGINNSNPQYPLDVSGDVNVSGTYYVNGVSQNPWILTGNAGTSPGGGNRLGTTDFNDLSIVTNALQAELLTALGLVGFQQSTPTAVVHVGAKAGLIATPGGAGAFTQIAASGYPFGSGDKNYLIYATASVSGTTIYSTVGEARAFFEESSSDFDVTGFVAASQNGSGYDPNIDSPPSYQIWGLYAGSSVQSIGTVTTSTDGGGWADTSQNKDVQISWSAPPGGTPDSYFIVRNSTDYQTTSSLSLLDTNSGWTGGTSPGLSDIQYSVSLFWTATDGASGYRVLNTDSTTFLDSVSPGVVDDATWASGSTVTPTTADYDSLKVDGDSQFETATFNDDVTISGVNLITDTTTGTKIATATNQKLGFFNATPVVQQTGDIGTALSNLGLVTSGSFSAANLTGNLITQHLIGSGSAPSIAAGAGAGTTPTVSLTGTDLAGAVSVTTGTLPTGTNAVVATITFNASYSTAPYVVLYPANAVTATLSGVSMVFVTSTTTTFVITSGTTALTGATAYKWNYHAIQ